MPKFAADAYRRACRAVAHAEEAKRRAESLYAKAFVAIGNAENRKRATTLRVERRRRTPEQQ
jgi:hypothetical protein